MSEGHPQTRTVKLGAGLLRPLHKRDPTWAQIVSQQVRVLVLEPGESRPVTVTLDDRAFAYFRPEARHWLVEPGKFTITVGFSAADAAALRGSVSRSNALLLPV